MEQSQSEQILDQLKHLTAAIERQNGRVTRLERREEEQDRMITAHATAIIELRQDIQGLPDRIERRVERAVSELNRRQIDAIVETFDQRIDDRAIFHLKNVGRALSKKAWVAVIGAGGTVFSAAALELWKALMT